METRKSIAAPLKLLTLAAMAAVLVLPAAAQDGSSPALELNFEEGGGSATSNENTSGPNGELSGDVYLDFAPRFGGFAEFFGPSGTITVPHAADLQPVAGTVHAWVMLSELQNADLIRKTTDLMVRSGIAGGFLVYGLRITSAGEGVACIANDDPSSVSFWTCVRSPRGLVQANRLTLLSMRWDGSLLSLFIDGRLAAAMAYNPVPGTGLSYGGTAPVRIGVASFWGGSIGWNTEFLGKMSKIAIYGRPQSDSEIHAEFATRGSNGSHGRPQSR